MPPREKKMTIPFWKMNGAGNDFVVLDNRDSSLHLTREQIALLCDRHRGIGADGLLAVEPPEAGADFRFRYYNADGGEAEMCGNGARCFAAFVNRLDKRSGTPVSFETIAGILSASFHGDDIEIAMSDPVDLVMHADLELPGKTLEIHSINTGVPHAVLKVDDLAQSDIIDIGAAVRYHEHFAPAGTNVNIYQSSGERAIHIRTYERGVEDETLACGTGMVACALVHDQLTGCGSPVSVSVKGGDVLSIAFERSGREGYHHVTLTGPADFVFHGEIDLP